MQVQFGRSADGLLPGEALQSDTLDDATHWTAVYEELVSFLRHTDLRIPTLDRYQRRLAYWRRRSDEIARTIDS